MRGELAVHCAFQPGWGRWGSALELLSKIDEPRALRALGRDELVQVTRELREHLIALGSEIGGHFAGSLGTVELTVALHTVFDTPHDRIVWDVGHPVSY